MEKIRALFPNCVTEVKDEKTGKTKLAVDFDILRQDLSDEVVDGPQERYQFTWPGKREAILLANAPTTNVLRPLPEKSVDFKHTKNVYIEGDNLESLKILRETYMGKIKMIYIDPPYNTGNDFVYHDDFKASADEYLKSSGAINGEDRLVSNGETNGRFHSDWLSMMYSRLILAKDLLREDGVIFISIDDHELDNLKKLCCEIFGEQNFVTNIVWQSTAGSNTGTDIITVTENVLVFTKSRSSFVFDGMDIKDETYSLSDEYESERGKYSLDKLDRRRVGPHYSEALNYPITMPDGSIRYPGGTLERNNEGWNYLWSKNKVEWGIKNGFIVFKKTSDGWGVYNKRYAKVDNDGKRVIRTTPYRNLILSNQCNTAQGTAELRLLFGFRPFDFPKPSSFIKSLMLTAIKTDKEALVMDFFSGSATTAQALMELNVSDNGNRRYILVQIPEKISEDSDSYKACYKTITDIGEERIRKVRENITNNNPIFSKNLDLGFRVFRVDSTNMKDVFFKPQDIQLDLLENAESDIKSDRTSLDLLTQSMLDLGITLDAEIEEYDFGGIKYYTINGNDMVACFDGHVGEAEATELAKLQPLTAVFRDDSFIDDAASTNCVEIFKTLSPRTKLRIL